MKLHHKLTDLFGYELIKKRKLNDTLDQHLRNVLEFLTINCVVDVGANEGSYGAMLRDRGYRGRIVSFEPLAGTFELLQETSHDDENWLALNFALGNEDSRTTIHRTAASAFSSFRRPNPFGLAGTRYPRHERSFFPEKEPEGVGEWDIISHESLAELQPQRDIPGIRSEETRPKSSVCVDLSTSDVGGLCSSSSISNPGWPTVRRTS